MPKFDYARASLALEATPLGPLNRKLAQYWLSLWDGNSLPSRSAFNPARVRDLLPGIVILAVRPGEAIQCRLAGSAIQMGLGQDITGKDWLAMTPADQRKTRMERVSTLCAGAASRNIRSGFTWGGSAVTAEELQLPFADAAEDGTRLLLSHTGWRSGTFDRRNPQVRDAHHVAAEFGLIPLAAA